MKKSKSFSTYGKYLEVRASITTDPELLKRTILKAYQNPLQVEKVQPKWIEGFDSKTGRSTLSSFQNFHTRDKNEKNNLQMNHQFIQPRSAFFKTKKQNQERLNMLLFDKEYKKGTKICKKHQNPERNQMIVTVRDLQNFRKSHHSMNFQKQEDRKNTYIKMPVGNEPKVEESPTNSTQNMLRMRRTHSFDSYTNRNFLSENIINKKCVSTFSGTQSFKIPMQNFKGSWKIVSAQKFQKSPNKSLNRYDAINAPFYTKLGYYTKQELTTKRSPVFQMSTLTGRKPNEVHSQYPMRMAL